MYIRNFLTLLRRYTTSSVLNIVGMAVAFAAVYLIAVQVKFDLSYNRVIPNSERIYRLEYPGWDNEMNRWEIWWNRQYPDKLAAICPEVEAAGSIDVMPHSRYQDEYSIKRNATIENFTISVAGAEPEGLAVFPFEMLAGRLEDLKTEDDLIISESTAKRFNLSVGDGLYYGRGAQNGAIRTIVAIYKDFPKPSSISMPMGYVLLEPQEQTSENDWQDSYYIRLQKGTDVEEIEQRMAQFVVDEGRKNGLSEEELKLEMARVTPRLTPINELYFIDDAPVEGYRGSRTTTYTLIAIAVLILVISFINFVNFFFALIPSRIRAVNNYKIFGAPTAKLRLNFLVETVGLILVSLFGAAVIVVLFADTPLKEYISTSVAIDENWLLAGAIALGVILFGVVVSLYPAWYITKFSPAFVIKGDFAASRAGRILRYTLVGVQYTISIALIICSIFVYRQHQYMLSCNMGFDRENLLSVEVPWEAVNPDVEGYQLDYTKRDILLDRLTQNPQIKGVAFGDIQLVSNAEGAWSRPLDGGDPVSFMIHGVSWNFLKVMGIEIVEGRDFLPSDEDTDTGAMIFNQTSVEKYGLTLESKIPGHVHSLYANIVGFCKDFNFKSANWDIEPFAFIVHGHYGWSMPRHTYIRTVAGADIAEVRKFVFDTLMEIAPNADPEKIKIQFFEQELELLYQVEDKLSTLVTLFSFLSIVISIIGVFGLVLFETQYRRREIGIRRVHGASVGGILQMFNRKYLYIVAACSAVAIPVSYYIIDQWMQQYVYRTPMSWWVYALAVGVILLITIVTVSLRSWSAANENPTQSIMK
ncbi:MAG: FtsX-like permease family protein [Rikenellaceae bacterium]|nr:FtsX-like permease family protein [Rikenellaceae bacterium]